MAWQFCTSNGGLYLDGEFICFGYSGHGAGLNCPDMEAEPCMGPIPGGEWRVEGPPFESITHGPYVLHLLPEEGTDAFGRSGFLMHGDSKAHPGQASLGCIILPLHVRQKVWESGVHELVVLHQPPVTQQAVS